MKEKVERSMPSRQAKYADSALLWRAFFSKYHQLKCDIRASEKDKC